MASLRPDIPATTEARTLWADLVQLVAQLMVAMEGTMGVGMVEGEEVMVVVAGEGAESRRQRR